MSQTIQSEPTTATRRSKEDERPETWRPALKEAGAAFVISALLWSVLYALFFFDFHTEFKRFSDRGDVPQLAFEGHQFIPVRAGNGGYKDGAAVIIEYQEGAAILELREAFIAEDYPFVKFHLEGLTTWSEAFVFWQQVDAPGVIHRLKLNRSGDDVTQVAMVYGGDAYKGQITTLALGLVSDPTDHDNNGVPVTLNSVELRPFSPEGVIEQIYEDWTNPPLWQGYSNNIVRGLHATGMLFPNLTTNLLVVTGILLGWLWRQCNKLRGRLPETRLLVVGLCLCLYGWAFNDILRWHWRAAQLVDTYERYAGRPLEQRIRNNPIRCGLRDDCFEHLLPYF